MNGIGPQIALLMHEAISEICEPLYFVDREMIEQAARLLGMKVPGDFQTHSVGEAFTITPTHITPKSGRYSYLSFKRATEYVREKKAEAVVTLPIHKEAWAKAGIAYKGHTDMLRDLFDAHAIMMLGCEPMYVALFTEHIPYKEVPSKLNLKCLSQFMLKLHEAMGDEKIAVLGLNPHAGDGGVLGDEDAMITQACRMANEVLEKEVFDGAIVPDTAFTPHMRQKYRLFMAIYHDQGLAPLKALYFDESINVSLNLPIVRTSVDHGTAFDIAYKGIRPNTQSYLNAVKEAVRLAGIRVCGHP